MASARYINVSSEALSHETLTVTAAFVCRSIFDDVRYEPKLELFELDDKINEKEGVELEQI